ncbi:pyruvate dehydrogenase (acetyl-transferring) E1 component subunit alpha [archaeon]|nr:MAG: pyruvate dehydrogenase (acetyl-transferring) E1 component subunit alpha [archaeon]
MKTFPVRYLQILNENGVADNPPKLSDEQMKRMYVLMVTTRVFDDTAVKLQREGRILTYASVKGQEAANVASAFALEKGDWMVPSFREDGSFITLDYPMDMLYQYWAGDERGMHIPDGMNILPIAIPVASQIPHAVGIAWAMKMRKEKNASIVYFGDGATSKGDFHEGLNFAGVFNLPCVFFCQNNQWAISLPRSKQTAAETIAQKAIAYGIEGIQVDGNDVFAVYQATKEALDRARQGKGATLIEAYTYRMSDHTTADDAAKYRTVEELKEWKKKDPIDRLEKFLIGKKILDEELKKEIWNDAQKKVEEAVKKAESQPPQERSETFKYVYENMPKNLEEME